MQDVGELTDWQLVELYRQWSEDHYAAGFIAPSKQNVRHFREWLHNPLRTRAETQDRKMYAYETEMLDEFKAQEADDA